MVHISEAGDRYALIFVCCELSYSHVLSNAYVIFDVQKMLQFDARIADNLPRKHVPKDRDA